MPHVFYELPIYLALVLVFFICNAISGLGYFVAHKFLSRVDNRDMVTKVVWQTVLFFSTIFITFWIATNWNNLGVLKQTTVREANSLELLYYDLDGLARSDKVTLQNQLNNYIDLVIEDEYPKLQLGERSVKTAEAFQNLVHAIYHYSPEETLRDESSYNRVIELLSQVSSLREARIEFLDGNLQGPLLLFFMTMIFVGCFWTGFIYTRSRTFNIFIILCQNLIISSSCWLILEMDKPFQGQLSIDNKPFIFLQQEIQSFLQHNYLKK